MGSDLFLGRCTFLESCRFGDQKVSQENLYTKDQVVWFSEQSCHAIVKSIRRPIGSAPYRYDIECDDGETLQYIEEDRLYPGILAPTPEEK